MDHHASHGGEALSKGADEAAAFTAWLFAQPCRFTFAAARGAELPPPALPEVAFAGRSNVGKSSLINALTGRRDLARTSMAPGRTQTLNFFDLGGRLALVDLPGYGFARAPRARIELWGALVDDYLQSRAALRRVCLLIDARRGAIDSDREVMQRLDRSAVVYQAVLTKIDAVKPGALADRRRHLADELASCPAAFPEIAATSARDGSGIAELRSWLAPLAGPGQFD